MNKIHQRRLITIIVIAFGMSVATGLVLYALKQNINVFLTPSQISSTTSNYQLRLGGVVKQGSVLHAAEGLGVQFIVTDYKRDVPVQYVGVLPDLFRETKGVIVEGKLNQHGTLIATQVLAKHDENYMPKNVYQALRKNVA